MGTHHPAWLQRVDVPLFVSHRWLHSRKRLKPSVTRWCCDSGGFTELNTHGDWQFEAEAYAAALDRYDAEIGMLDWAAPMDWMCEPWILAKTGFDVEEHQYLTIDNVLRLRSLTDVHVIPVLQGWTMADYERCVELYDQEGIDLTAEPVVGLGSVCRRQRTNEIHDIVRELHSYGLALHGFGVKTLALRKISHLLVSADSMSWSFTARREKILLPGCTSHQRCNNCEVYAKKWRRELLNSL